MAKYPRYVYSILNMANGKQYIGSSANPQKRFESHISLLKGGKHPVENMQFDYDKYGDFFILRVIDEMKSRSYVNKEYEWMKVLKTFQEENGYNYKDFQFRKYALSRGYTLKEAR